MIKSIDPTMITDDNQIISYGKITVEYSGDSLTEEIVTEGIKAMQDMINSYHNSIGGDKNNE